MTSTERRRRRPWGAALAMMLAAAAPAAQDPGGEDAAALHEEGLAVLARGELEAAQVVLVRAARAEPDNATYRDHAALVRSALQVRAYMEGERDPANWEISAKSLRDFYRDFRVYEEARLLDEQRYARRKTPAVVADLAESRLERGLEREAEELLRTVPAAERTPVIQARLGVALARQGKRAAAEAALTSCPEEPEEAGCDAPLLLELACLSALLDDLDGAAAHLARSFARTPPSRLAALKAYASARADLAALRASPAAERVWATASEVAESECSTGADCGTCPSRATCDDGDGS